MLAKERSEAEILQGDIPLNKEVQLNLRAVGDLNKQIDIIERDISVLNEQIAELQQDRTEKRSLLQQQVYSVSMLISRLSEGNEIPDMDAIFLEEDNVRGQNTRQSLNDLINKVRFTYVYDPLVQPTNQILQTIVRLTPDWGQD